MPQLCDADEHACIQEAPVSFAPAFLRVLKAGCATDSEQPVEERK